MLRKSTVNPIDAVIAVTYKCNSRCIMCNVWKNQASKEDLNPTLFSKLPPSLRNINISGGEPLLREDLTEIIEVISKRCSRARLAISTNGLAPKLMETQMSKIVKVNKDIAVRVSIDGTNDLHERMRNIKNAFEKTQQSIKILKELKIKDIGISFTATNHNLNELLKLYELAKQQDVAFTFCGVAHDSEIEGYFGKGNEKLKNLDLLKKQINVIISERLKSWQPSNWARAYYQAGIYHRELTNKRLIPCGALDYLFYLDPYGDVFSCNIANKKVGNIQESNFEEIWSSEKAKQTREFVKACPYNCWMICTVSPFIMKNLHVPLGWVIRNKAKAHLNKDVL